MKIEFPLDFDALMGGRLVVRPELRQVRLGRVDEFALDEIFGFLQVNQL